MMNRFFKIALLSLTLTSCTTNNKVLNRTVFYFDTMVDVKLFEGEEENLNGVLYLLEQYSGMSDNYQNYPSEGINVYDINHTNEEVEVANTLYALLEKAFDMKNHGATYFNPLCGSLSKKWKDALAKGETLSDSVINAEISKINSSSLSFKGESVQRNGDAEIDLGGIAKGYALDFIKQYLDIKELSKYIIDAGSSSILLGESDKKDGYFTVSMKDLHNTKYLRLKNCFISTSSISEQGVKIGDVTYSHIINPVTGSAINEQDAVIVISDNGALGDALSTSMMLNTVEEIKAIEQTASVKTIVIKNNSIIYNHPDLQILNR